MTPTTRGALSALLLGLSTLSFGCAATTETSTSADDVSSASSETIRASAGAELYAARAAWAVHRAHSAEDFVDVRLYEISGGDPAANGTHLWLTLQGSVDDFYTWDLGANVRSVTKVEVVRAGLVRFEGTTDMYDEEALRLTSVPFVAFAQYTKDADMLLSPLVEFAFSSEAADLEWHDLYEATDDESSRFLSSVFDITVAERGGVVARVFETMGGDPIINGDHLYLSLMTHPEDNMFDLGLNVASVSSVSFARDGRLLIEGTEDTWGEDGPTPQPFTYRVDFALEGHDPPSKVKLTRVR
jgi:hypothetical protein